MKKEELKRQIEQYKSAGNKIYGFYVTYKADENIISQEWGTIDKFEKILSKKQMFLLKRAENRFARNMLSHSKRGHSSKTK